MSERKGKTKAFRILVPILFALVFLLGLFLIFYVPLKTGVRKVYSNKAINALRNGETSVDVPITDALSVDGEDWQQEIGPEKFIIDMSLLSDKYQKLTLSGLLEIPCIEVEQPIFSEASTLALRYGCGIFSGTASIGEKGLCSIWGHRDLKHPKNALGSLQYLQDHIGEEVLITTPDYVLHKYEIVECRYAKDGAVMPWMYKDTYDEEMLCIVTCGFGKDPARPGKTYPYNTEFVVICKPVGTEKLVD